MKSRQVPLFAAVILLSAFVPTIDYAQVNRSEGPVIGRLTRDQVEAAVARWQIDSRSDPNWTEKVEALRHVRRGATVTVFLGMWCADSKREVPQFMRILDVLEHDAPFNVEFIGVDEGKKQPRNEVEANQIWYLPTFIIFRDGLEVGRIVEHPARTLEKDLLRLLDGSARGLVSSNEDAIARYLTSWRSPSEHRRLPRNSRVRP